ncbi:leucine-rich repeat domain-containing protein [Paenibacillus vandeheii]
MKERIELNPGWTREEVVALTADSNLKIIQYSEHNVPDVNLMQILNEELFANRPDVTFRIYGFHLQSGDLSVLKYMNQVEKLVIDCNSSVRGIEAISTLPRLREFAFDVFEADSLDVLALVPTTLQQLRIGKTKTKKTDLSVLSRFNELKTLIVNGHTRNIETIGTLISLRSLYISGIPLKELGYLKDSTNLRELHLSFGGAENLDSLAGMESLQLLKLLRVKGLSDLSVLSELKGLRLIGIEDQPHLTNLPTLEHLTELRRVCLNNVNIENIAWAKTTGSLKELALLQMKQITAEDIESLIHHKTLERMIVHLKNAKQQKVAKQAIMAEGIWDESGWWYNEEFLHI